MNLGVVLHAHVIRVQLTSSRALRLGDGNEIYPNNTVPFCNFVFAKQSQFIFNWNLKSVSIRLMDGRLSERENIGCEGGSVWTSDSLSWSPNLEFRLLGILLRLLFSLSPSSVSFSHFVMNLSFLISFSSDWFCYLVSFGVFHLLMHWSFVWFSLFVLLARLWIRRDQSCTCQVKFEY